MSAILTNGISHVGLSVTDIDKTATFFKAIGFKAVGGDESYPSIFLSDGCTMVTLWSLKSEHKCSFDRTRNTGLHHLALNVPNEDALNAVYDVVQKLEGVKIEFGPRKIDGMPMTHMMCYEPCGARIEFAYHSA